MKKVIGIIPARYGSMRLPGKPLRKVRGKTIIERVYERVKLATTLEDVIVATDDIRIANHVEKFGGKAMITRIDHRSGTLRCAEVVGKHPADYVINIQGDEPMVNPSEIDRLAKFVTSGCKIATLVKQIDGIEDIRDPSVAKVILDGKGRAILFSRSPIPYVRDFPMEQWLEKYTFFKHVGMYAYERKTLLHVASLPSSHLEQAESLEQLNWLYHGIEIRTLETDVETIDINTPEDLEILEKILAIADNS